MLVEAEQRRYPGFAAERPMTNQVASAPASSREVPDGLDWHTFSAASFPGRRRHDLQASDRVRRLQALVRGRRAHTGNPSRIVAKRGAVASTALQEWEDEGGAAF